MRSFCLEHGDELLILAFGQLAGCEENVDLFLKAVGLAALDHALQSAIQHSRFPPFSIIPRDPAQAGSVGIRDHKEQLSKPKSTIEQLVDKVCGYNEVEEVKKEAITLLEQIVESKKAIGVNYSGDSKFLDKLKNKETHE